ncbi:MAG TPA: hypothetical protein V6C76_02410 [Drouetiella sp.]
MSNHSDDQGTHHSSADLLDGFTARTAEHDAPVETPRTGLVLFSFGRRGGFAKPGDDKRSANVVA